MLFYAVSAFTYMLVIPMALFDLCVSQEICNWHTYIFLVFYVGLSFYLPTTGWHFLSIY